MHIDYTIDQKPPKKKKEKVHGGRRWNPETALACLKRNRVSVDVPSRLIVVRRPVGIKVLGTIDYLTNYCGFNVLFTNEVE